MIPSNRVATHPGVILLKEFIEPLGLSQKAVAANIGIPVQRINEIVRVSEGCHRSFSLIYKQLTTCRCINQRAVFSHCGGGCVIRLVWIEEISGRLHRYLFDTLNGITAVYSERAGLAVAYAGVR